MSFIFIIFILRFSIHILFNNRFSNLIFPFELFMNIQKRQSIQKVVIDQAGR
jgi:hypothetical protein